MIDLYGIVIRSPGEEVDGREHGGIQYKGRRRHMVLLRACLGCSQIPDRCDGPAYSAWGQDRRRRGSGIYPEGIKLLQEKGSIEGLKLPKEKGWRHHDEKFHSETI